MTRWAAITYREFWDVPRIFVIKDRGQNWLFECPFDSATEDFPEHYLVYLMPTRSTEDLVGS